ncbi:MAG: hypothetical protein N4A68_01705 [Maledivibacter sp.]|jgi:hypothetical protein|nr:hypothetical protein [Maledivibacter sp.]
MKKITATVLIILLVFGNLSFALANNGCPCGDKNVDTVPHIPECRYYNPNWQPPQKVVNQLTSNNYSFSYRLKYFPQNKIAWIVTFHFTNGSLVTFEAAQTIEAQWKWVKISGGSGGGSHNDPPDVGYQK